SITTVPSGAVTVRTTLSVDSSASPGSGPCGSTIRISARTDSMPGPPTCWRSLILQCPWSPTALATAFLAGGGPAARPLGREADANSRPMAPPRAADAAPMARNLLGGLIVRSWLAARWDGNSPAYAVTLCRQGAWTSFVCTLPEPAPTIELIVDGSI